MALRPYTLYPFQPGDRTPAMREVMHYVDLRLLVDTQPDQNNNCWLYFWRNYPDIDTSFDLKPVEAQALRDALDRYLIRCLPDPPDQEAPG